MASKGSGNTHQGRGTVSAAKEVKTQGRGTVFATKGSGTQTAAVRALAIRVVCRPAAAAPCQIIVGSASRSGRMTGHVRSAERCAVSREMCQCVVSREVCGQQCGCTSTGEKRGDGGWKRTEVCVRAERGCGEEGVAGGGAVGLQREQARQPACVQRQLARPELLDRSEVIRISMLAVRICCVACGALAPARPATQPGPSGGQWQC